MRYMAELYSPDGQERQRPLGSDYQSDDAARQACTRYAETELTWERRGLEWWARGAHWWLRVSPVPEEQAEDGPPDAEPPAADTATGEQP